MTKHEDRGEKGMNKQLIEALREVARTGSGYVPSDRVADRREMIALGFNVREHGFFGFYVSRAPIGCRPRYTGIYPEE